MAKLGASAGWKGNYAQDLTATSTLGSGDSGKIFFLNHQLSLQQHYLLVVVTQVLMLLL